MAQVSLINDEPTLVDRLNRRGLVRDVGEVIATCQPPQVFGIHGDWGMGKTSFLHQVQLYLTNRSGMRRRALQFHYETAGVEEVTEEEKLAVFRHFRGKSECPLLGADPSGRRTIQYASLSRRKCRITGKVLPIRWDGWTIRTSGGG